MTRGEGAGTRKCPAGGWGAYPVRAAKGPPLPFMRSPHPPSPALEGWGAPLLSPEPPRETHLRGLECMGGAPLIFAGQGRWGSVYEKRKPGGGVWQQFWMAPPLSGDFGEGWGVRGRDFLGSCPPDTDSLPGTCRLLIETGCRYNRAFPALLTGRFPDGLEKLPGRPVDNDVFCITFGTGPADDISAGCSCNYWF